MISRILPSFHPPPPGADCLTSATPGKSRTAPAALYILEFPGGADKIVAPPALSSEIPPCYRAPTERRPRYLGAVGKGPRWNGAPAEGGLPQRPGKIPGAFHWPPQERPSPLVFQYTYCGGTPGEGRATRGEGAAGEARPKAARSRGGGTNPALTGT